MKKITRTMAGILAVLTVTAFTPQIPMTILPTASLTAEAVDSVLDVKYNGLKFSYLASTKTLEISSDTSTEISFPTGEDLEGALISDCLNATDHLVIKDGITKICENCFLSKHFQDIVIADSVTEIEEGAFQNVWWINDVPCTIQLGNGLKTIGKEAFASAKIATISLPDSVTSIGESAFEGSSLNSIKLPAQYGEIPKKCFYKCTSLTSISLPSTITEIGESAFQECSSLASVTVHEGLTTIGESAFYQCGALKAFDFPSTVRTIKDYAFRETGLTEVVIPYGVTTIPYQAFSYCSDLKSVSLPASVSIIGNMAFAKCSNLETLNLTEGLTAICDGAFWTCNSLTKVIIPQTVDYIGYGAFGIGDTTNHPSMNIYFQWEKFDKCRFLGTSLEDGELIIDDSSIGTAFLDYYDEVYYAQYNLVYPSEDVAYEYQAYLMDMCRIDLINSTVKETDNKVFTYRSAEENELDSNEIHDFKLSVNGYNGELKFTVKVDENTTWTFESIDEFNAGDSGFWSEWLTYSEANFASLGTDFWFTITPNTAEDVAGLSTIANVYLHLTLEKGNDGVIVTSASLHSKGEGETGDTKLTNIPIEIQTGSLTVENHVKDNDVPDSTDEFHVRITLTAKDETSVNTPIKITYSDGSIITIPPMNSTDTSDFSWDNGSCVVNVTLKDDEYVTIDNIPFGVTYRVDEIEPKSDDTTITNAHYDWIIPTYDFESCEITGESPEEQSNTSDSTWTANYVTGGISDEWDKVNIYNNRFDEPESETNIDVGVLLENLPFILLLTTGITGGALLTLRKKREEDLYV